MALSLNYHMVLFAPGLWYKINDIIRIWAARYGPLQIITGAIFDSNGDGFRDEDKEINR